MRRVTLTEVLLQHSCVLRHSTACCLLSVAFALCCMCAVCFIRVLLPVRCVCYVPCVACVLTFQQGVCFLCAFSDNCAPITGRRWHGKMAYRSIISMLGKQRCGIPQTASRQMCLHSCPAVQRLHVSDIQFPSLWSDSHPLPPHTTPPHATPPQPSHSRGGGDDVMA